MYKNATKGNRGAAIWMCIFLAGITAGCGSRAEENRLAEEPAAAVAGEGAKQKKEEETSGAESLEPEALAQGDNFGYGAASYDSVQDFSYRLLEQNLEQANPVLSPVSAYLAMGMAGEGAQGETLEEFQDVLGADFSGLSKELMGRLQQNEKDMEVFIANSVWMDENLAPKREWRESAEGLYEADVFQVGLTSRKAQKDINAWVKKKTRGLIENFLEAPLSENTMLALLDTVYFKGKWQQSFKAQSTGRQKFTTACGEVVMTDMMRKYGEEQQYLRSDDLEGIVLPYAGGRYSFVALKPVGNTTVRDMYNQLSMEEIAKLLASRQNVLVNLEIPKFEIVFDQKLNTSFMNMGITSAFDPVRADFSGIVDDQENPNQLYISLVRQKAVIKVDEDGTEAAAATEVEMRSKGGMPSEESSVNLVFDEPFFYMILENETEVPLFMGILDNPA